jgi:hypothetical protein
MGKILILARCEYTYLRFTENHITNSYDGLSVHQIVKTTHLPGV